MTTRTFSTFKAKAITLITPEYLLSNYSSGGSSVAVYLQSYDKYTSNYRQDITVMSNVLKVITDKHLDHINLYINNVHCKDVELKTKLIGQLQLAEYISTTTQTVKPLTPQMVQTAKDTVVSQKEVVALIAALQKNITELSIKDCKKIQVALTRI